MLDRRLVNNDVGDSIARAEFLSDIGRVTYCFAQVAQCSRIECRLEWIHDDACSKFHRDNVKIRLLSTYVGPGTVFVSPHDACDALSAQHRYSGRIIAAPRGSVVIMRGGKDGGVVHRSPAIEGAAFTRILLCLDPADGPAS